ncbi:MAG: hypothetical protein C0514_03785 [Candidatus Puniceispirillum sp.]|nr:hypothetical protein [Candidatus Puniceispirillum sp.]
MRLFFPSLIVLSQLCFVPCFSSATPEDAPSHFDSGAHAFASHLAHTHDATLDFFWTTGVTLSDNPSYAPDAHVYVGGTPAYGAKFFPYVASLLEHTPAHLRVRFVCDGRTQEANRAALDEVSGAFGTRFEIINIEDVVARLHDVFPEKREVLGAVFDNATRGNPAIASDIYRLIGMYFGHAPADLSTPIQRTYCDVDTFIHAMDASGYEKLIEALFGVSSLSNDNLFDDALNKLRAANEDAFMMWRNNTGNSLIKMRLGQKDVHHVWCQDVVLNRIDPTQDWLLGRTKLHDAIRAFETCDDADKEDLFYKALGHDKAEPKDVIDGTGPGFTDGGPHMVMSLNYPDTCTWAWSGVQGLKAGKPVMTFVADRSLAESFIGWDFKYSCEVYTDVVNAALQAKRFGVLHPFTQYALDYLKNNNPYTANRDSLRALIWDDYEVSGDGYSPEKWQRDRFLALTWGPRDVSKLHPHYLHLKSVLEKLGAPFEELREEELSPLSAEEKLALNVRLTGEDS